MSSENSRPSSTRRPTKRSVPGQSVDNDQGLNTSTNSILQSPHLENSITSVLQSPRTPLSRFRNFGISSQSQGVETQERLIEDINLLSSPIMFTETPTSRLGLGTPSRHRSDIRSDNRITRHVNIQGLETNTNLDNSIDVLRTTNVPANKLVIWGTDIVIDECKSEFLDFITNFTPYISLTNEEQAQLENYDLNSPLYIQKLEHMNITEKYYLDIDGMHLKKMKPKLYDQLVIYPQEVIPAFDTVINELSQEIFENIINKQTIQVRIFNIDKTRNMRDLDPDDIDKLVSINGLVIRSSGIIPEMYEAFFQCYNCHFTITVEIDCGRIIEPTVCTNCNTTRSLSIIHNRSKFSDKQVIKLQESPDDMPAGQTPYTVLLFAHNDLVNQVQPGDRIIVTGIYRASPTRLNPRIRTVRSVYRTFIDVVHFDKMSKNRLYAIEQKDQNNDITNFTQERIEQLKEMSQDPNIYSKLANAIAPSIFENEDIKKGILLQLFGGTIKDFTKAGRSRFRSEINVLLCGDPGTSKSQLLKYVHNIMPRGQYTSGKGSSAVGLTVYITKDPDTKQLVLQTGALVMSDNGICCIDEFDKMNDTTRSVLHEVMEQQTLSIAKAGIICQLNARTSILAAANPVKSRWDMNLTTVENIKLPHTLLSRFDLIFLMLDTQNETFDQQLALHLVSLYSSANTQNDIQNNDIDLNILKDYIAYARANIHPKLSEEASQYLVHIYIEMRRFGNINGSITAYPRQLESLIRLSEAHAKMRFSNIVEIIDVEEAKRLHREALKQSCIDPKTGMIDVNILTTGMTLTTQKQRIELSRVIKQLLDNKFKDNGSRSYITQEIFEQVRANSDKQFNKDEFDMALQLLVEDNYLTITAKHIKLVE